MKQIGILAAGALLIAGLVLAFTSSPLQAQSAQELACQGAGGTFTPADPIDPQSTASCDSGGQGSNLGPLFKTIANILLLILGSIAVIMLIIGGLRYVISAGDSNAVEGAKNTILYAIVGIVVAFLAYAAVNFVVGQLGSGGQGDEGIGTIDSAPVSVDTATDSVAS